MSDVEQLITDNLDGWSSAVKTRSSAGRGSSKKLTLHGIKKLRELILELAVRGLLVPQSIDDEPASALLERISAEKEQLVKEGEIKNQKKLPSISEEGMPFIKVHNIQNQEIDFAHRPQFINPECHAGKFKRATLYPGDVVMNIVGPPLGKVAIIPSAYPEWNCNQNVTFFRQQNAEP